MSFWELFTQLDNKIAKLSIIKKIKFFSLPLLLSILLLSIFYNKNSFYFSIKKENRVFSENYIKIIKDFTEYFNTYNINLKEIKQVDKAIELSFFTQFSQLIKIIYYLETYNNFSYIVQLVFLNENNEFLINLKVVFKDFYLKNKELNLKELPKKHKSLSFKIEAIVMNYVLIENSWYTIGDNINSYKIIRISNDFIELKKDNKIQKVFFYE